MGDTGGSVTLIFYRIESPWREPFLNLLAAAAQLSAFTHVEIAIGAHSQSRACCYPPTTARDCRSAQETRPASWDKCPTSRACSTTTRAYWSALKDGQTYWAAGCAPPLVHWFTRAPPLRVRRWSSQLAPGATHRRARSLGNACTRRRTNCLCSSAVLVLEHRLLQTGGERHARVR